VAAMADRIIAGGPFDDPAPFMGPVVDLNAAAKVVAAWDALVARGGAVIRPLQRLQDGTRCFRPR